MKLKSVSYAKLNGYIYAIETYEDYSVKVVKIENGITNYILTGTNELKKIEELE